MTRAHAVITGCAALTAWFMATGNPTATAVTLGWAAYRYITTDPEATR